MRIRFLLLIPAFFTVSCITPDTSAQDKQDEKRTFEKEYSIFAIKHPQELYFAGERVPLENLDVKEGYDKEIHVNTYWQSQTMLFIKRANKYFPVIEPILKKNGIPDDFKYITLIESGLENLVSPAKAVGFWQLMEGTARDYGLEVNSEVDERYHYEKATVAACEYFKSAYEKFQSWTLVAASYNVGMRGIDRQIERQKETNYYDLLLNTETSRYVYRILAVKQLLENPNDYGFFFEEEDLYHEIPYNEIEVNTAVADFADFAKEHGTNYKILKTLNPWLRESYLTNKSHKTYVIRIPVEGGRTFKPSKEDVVEEEINSNL